MSVVMLTLGAAPNTLLASAAEWAANFAGPVSEKSCGES